MEHSRSALEHLCRRQNRETQPNMGEKGNLRSLCLLGILWGSPSSPECLCASANSLLRVAQPTCRALV